MLLNQDRINYWLKMAEDVENSENPCYSRKIGVVIVDPINDTLVSIGHNGPPKGSPKCDDPLYLKEVVFPQLTDEEKEFSSPLASITSEIFSSTFGNCEQCPRKIIGAKSSKRLEICVCSHAEHNAILNAHRDVTGFYMICHCGVPCVECSKTIVGSGIKVVVCQKRDEDYSPYSSRWILKHGGVELLII